MFQINIDKDHNEIWNDLASIIPFLKPWLKQQRWSGLSNVEKFNIETEIILPFIEQSDLKIIGYFLAINANITQLTLFLPLIYYLNQQKSNSIPEIVINTKSSKIFINQAECYQDFISLLIENFQKQKTHELKKGLYFKFNVRIDTGFDLAWAYSW